MPFDTEAELLASMQLDPREVEFNVEEAQYLAKTYAKWLVKESRVMSNCDFCGRKSEVCVRLVSKKNDKNLDICSCCGAYYTFDSYIEDTKSMFLQSVGFNKEELALSVPPIVPNTGGGFLVETTKVKWNQASEALNELVNEAKTHWDNKVLGSWELIPDIISKYKTYKKLSDKQYNALIKYVSLCKKQIASKIKS